MIKTLNTIIPFLCAILLSSMAHSAILNLTGQTYTLGSDETWQSVVVGNNDGVLNLNGYDMNITDLTGDRTRSVGGYTFYINAIGGENLRLNNAGGAASGAYAFSISSASPSTISITNANVTANQNVYGLIASQYGFINIQGTGAEQLIANNNRNSGIFASAQGTLAGSGGVITITNMDVTANTNLEGISATLGGTASIINGNIVANGNRGTGILAVDGAVNVTNGNIVANGNITAGILAVDGVITITGKASGENIITTNANSNGINIIGSTGSVNIVNSDIVANGNAQNGISYSDGALTIVGVAAGTSSVSTNDNGFRGINIANAKTLTLDKMHVEASGNKIGIELSGASTLNLTGTSNLLKLDNNTEGGIFIGNGSTLNVSGKAVAVSGGNYLIGTGMGANNVSISSSTISTSSAPGSMFVVGGMLDTFVLHDVISSGFLTMLVNTVGNTASLTINESDLEGAVLSGGGTTLVDLTDTVWKMKKDSDMSYLSLTGSVADLRSDTVGVYNTLTTDDYVGSGGEVYMNTVLGDDTSNTDKIVIKGGTAGGTTSLVLTTTGAGDQTINGIKLIEAQSGATIASGTFSLFGGVVDSGAYEYKLFQGGVNDGDTQSMYLRSTPTPTNTSNTIVNILAVHYSIVKTGLNELVKRLGDLRTGDDVAKSGAWVRTYGKSLHVDDTINSKMNLYGVEGGIDFVALADNAKTLYVGFMAGLIDTDNIKTRQTTAFSGKANATTPSVGAYAVWVGKTGSYVDATVRYFWSRMNAKNYTAQGNAITYDANRDFIAATLEVGHRWKYEISEYNSYFIEPKAELQYMYSDSDNFSTNTGNAVHYDTTEGFSPKIGLMLGMEHKVSSDSLISPYFQAMVGYEFDGVTRIKYARSDFKSDLHGVNYEFTLGVNAKVNKSWDIYSHVMYEVGTVYEGTSGQIGLRYNF